MNSLNNIEGNRRSKLNANSIYASRRQDMRRTNIRRTNIGRTDMGRTNIGRTNIGRTDMGRANMRTTDIRRADMNRRTNMNRRTTTSYLVPAIVVCALIIVLSLSFAPKAKANDSSKYEKIFCSYVVKYGDTLNGIAYDFCLTLDYTNYINEVMTINEIEDGDTLLSGTVLIIPCYIQTNDLE